jgi:hypothetical protein
MARTSQVMLRPLHLQRAHLPARGSAALHRPVLRLRRGVLPRVVRSGHGDRSGVRSWYRRDRGLRVRDPNEGPAEPECTLGRQYDPAYPARRAGNLIDCERNFCAAQCFPP